MDPQRTPMGRAEGWVALLVALVLAAIPIRAALFDADTVLFGVDTACAQLPWSTGAAANPELSDQGVVFYPAYREVSRRWRAGEIPLWNPHAYAGAPLLANPQLGALDPQVLLPIALEAVGGRAGFDRGLTWMAWLRIAAAGLGAYLLARELGLGREGAALAGITFGGSGFVVLWLNHSLGHVAPLLPWVLLGVERARSARGFVGCALALALAIYGGHPETSFYVGAAAGVWSLGLLRRERRHGLRALAALACGTALAAPLLVPFVEYLALSGARLARAVVVPPALDLVALGALLVAVAWARDLCGALEGLGGRRVRLARSLAFFALLVFLASTVDWPTSLALLALPDVFGTPAMVGGWRGTGSFLETASTWVPAASVALALAAALTPRGAGILQRRGLVIGMTAVALALALRLPGLDAVHAHLPGLGASAPVRLAVVSALGLALLAGEALERAPRLACAAAALCVALGAAATVFAPRPELPHASVAPDPSDGLVEVLRPPPARMASGALLLELWLHPGIPAGGVGLVAERAQADGTWRAASKAAWPLVRDDALVGDDAPAGARGYRLEGLDARALAEGTWRLSLVLDGAQGERLGDRVLGALRVERAPRPSPATWLFLAASLLAVARLGFGAAAQSRRLVLAVAALQALTFAEGQNPAVALERVFPPTRTEEILREVLADGGRFLADPGILPPGTSLALGLRCADGYDAMDPASFDLLRPYVVREGVHPLLGFTPSGVDLASPAFQLLGVHAMVTRTPFEHEGWSTVAGPGQAEFAEVYIATPDDPPPRAFLVGRARALADVASSPAALRASDFAPFEEVLLEDPSVWTPATPMSTGRVATKFASPERIEFDLELDGHALLVVGEQSFPGWTAEVDGTPREVLTVDGTFLAVPVRAGDRQVVLDYSRTRIGLTLTLIALAAAALASVQLRRPSQP